MSYLEHESRAGLLGFVREVREGLRRQGNVVFALIFKEIKNRSKSEGYGLFSLVGVLLEPVAAVVTMMVFFYFIRRSEVDGVHIALFIAVSYIPFAMIRRSISTIPKVVKSNSAFYAYQQVKPFDSVLARFSIEIALTLLGGVLILFLLWWFLGLQVRFNRMPQAIGMLLMMIATGFGLSLFFGTYCTLYPFVSRITSLLSQGLLVLSAVIHPMKDLQAKAGAILLWNPLAHMEELLRFYALDISYYQGVTVAFPLGFMLLSLFLGFAAYYAKRHELLKR